MKQPHVISAEKMEHQCIRGLISRTECGELLDDLCRQASIVDPVAENILMTHLVEGLEQSEVLTPIYRMMTEEVERLTGRAMTRVYDWAVKGPSSHMTYHQDELAYMDPLASCYTAWLLLDRSYMSPCAGLDIIPYRKNESFYKDIFQHFDRRCLLLRDTVQTYYPDSNTDSSIADSDASLNTRLTTMGSSRVKLAAPVTTAMRLTRLWLREKCSLKKPVQAPSPARPITKTYDQPLHIDRYEDLEPGDFMLFNTGLIHSCSNPHVARMEGYKFFYKITFIQSDTVVSNNPVDDFCPWSSFASAEPGARFGSLGLEKRRLYVRVSPASRRSDESQLTQREHTHLPHAVIHRR